MMSENRYRVFNKGVKGIRKMYPLETFLDTAFEATDKDPNSDFYESIYVYTDEHKKQLETTKTLSGISGIKTDRIVFDFDSKDISLAQNDAKELVTRLKVDFQDEAIRIFFSANKGFHVEVHLNKFLSREKFETVIDSFAGDLNTFDTKIKDEQRLFRFPLTKHNKSGLYKIPLTQEQLYNFSVDQIKELATQIRPEFYDLMNSYITVNIDESKYQSTREKKEVKQTDFVPQDRPDLSRKPKHLTAAKFVLQEGFFEEGERNEACMILASTYKYLGYNERHTYNIIKGTLALRAQRLGHEGYDKEELYNTIIKPIYSPTWKGGTFSEEDGLLKRTIDRYDLNKISPTEAGLVAVTSIANNFKIFAQNIESNTIKLGIDEIDRKVRITTGMLVAFLAAPGAGKSSAAFGILNNLSKSGEKAIFFSMDMGADQVYQRLIQKHTGHDSDRILKNYENNIVGEIETYENLLSENYQNIKFCFKTSLTPELIRAIVVQEFQMTGSYPKMILLDYLECIQTGINDPTQSKAVAALALKDIANEFGINVFLLTQPTKLVGGPAGELTSYTQIKGSGVVGEQATIVLTMSRPGFNPKSPDDDNYVTINVVKNRMGPLSSTDLHWNGLTGHIRSLSHEEENDLKALRAAIAAEKNDKDDLY